MSEPTSDVVPLTEAEREALWTVWESDVDDDAELAGAFFAVVAVIAAARVAAAHADERERITAAVDRISDLYPPDSPPRGDYERGRRDAYANAQEAFRAVLNQPEADRG